MRIIRTYQRPLTRYGFSTAGSWNQVRVLSEGHVNAGGERLDLRGLTATQRKQIRVQSGGAEATLHCEPPNDYTLTITQTIPTGTALPANTDHEQTTFPYYAVGSAPAISFTSANAGNVGPLSDANFAAQFKSRIQAAANKFVDEYNPMWSVLVSRDGIANNYDSAVTLETTARNRADTLGDHFRGWCGLCSQMYYYLSNGWPDFVAGLAATFDRPLMTRMVNALEAEVGLVRRWYANADVGAFSGYHDFRQIWRTDTSNWRGDTAHLYLAPGGNIWSQLRTIWFQAGWLDQYPTPPTIAEAIDKGPADEMYQEENTLTHTLTAPSGATSISYQWQRFDPDTGTIANITNANRNAYQLVSQDVDNQVRCRISYLSGGLNLIGARNWTPRIA